MQFHCTCPHPTLFTLHPKVQSCLHSRVPILFPVANTRLVVHRSVSTIFEIFETIWMGTASKWFLLFFSDFPVFQFVTFNCSYNIDYMPKNIEIKKFKGFKHLPMYQVCCLPLVYCFKYNQFVKKTFMLRSTRNPFLHPLSGVPQASTPMLLWRWCTHLFSHRELVWLAADFGPHFYCLHKQKDLILQ